MGIAVIALVVLTLVVSPACVSKKDWRASVEGTDTRMNSVENAVEANENRIKDLNKETDDALAALERKTDSATEVGNTAMATAELAAAAAEAAANGRLVWTLVLADSDVRFGFGQAGVTEEAAAALDDLAAKVLAMEKAVFVEIQGHTDNIGNEGYNLELGLLRAATVRRYLNMEAGVPLHAMDVISYGESEPVADNSTPEGRANNRRVVVNVYE